MWQKAKKPLEIFIIAVVRLLVIALAVMIVLAYLFNVNVPGLRGKNLWDWLQLLIIPAVLAIGGYLFNFATSRTEREIALDKQREDALQAYIDSMSVLLLEKNLRKSGEGDEVRKIAQVRTLTVLSRLDRDRKKSVLQFLHDAGLIARVFMDDNSIGNTSIVSLYKADLRGANLSEAFLLIANLSNADLRGANLNKTILDSANLDTANLSEANLSEATLLGADLGGTILYGANLHGADLSSAYLSGADLSKADLTEAIVTTEQLKRVKSLQGATMPDGTKHA